MFYTLNLVCEDPELRQAYERTAAEHNANVDKRDADPGCVCCDAGYDLHVPEPTLVMARATAKIGHQVYCSMDFNDGSSSVLCGYYLYPRSSTGTKTGENENEREQSKQNRISEDNRKNTHVKTKSRERLTHKETIELESSSQTS